MTDDGIPGQPPAARPTWGYELSQLVAANVDPATGLSTDYLNHFGEAIMLLDLSAQAPEYGLELARWRPISYREYFAASQLAHRELSIAAYEAAEPQARSEFDALCATMSSVILAAAAAHASSSGATAETLARLKALFARASAVVHGPDAVSGNASRLASARSLVEPAPPP
jgi:hypothetical protein